MSNDIEQLTKEIRELIDYGCRDNEIAEYLSNWKATQSQPEQRSAVAVPEGWRQTLERIAHYPRTRDQELSEPAMRQMARDALTAAPTASQTGDTWKPDAGEQQVLHNALKRSAVPVEGGGVPVPSFWASEAQETEQLIDGRPRKLWWECRPGVGTPYYTHPHNGEQGGEWVRCDERLPTGKDADFFGNVFACKEDVVDVVDFSFVIAESSVIDCWMPTGLKRPNPPTERENKQ